MSARIDFCKIRNGCEFEVLSEYDPIVACCASPFAAVFDRHPLVRVSHTTVFPASLKYVDRAVVRGKLIKRE